LNQKGRMKITKGEIIGKEIKIVGAKNKSNVSIEGKIVDETRNTIVVLGGGKEKRLLKNNITILFKKEGLKVEGRLLAGRPEERIKK